MKQVWMCDSCGRTQKSKTFCVCPGCGKETCNGCTFLYAHCKSCCVGKYDEDLLTAATVFGYDFMGYKYSFLEDL